MKKHTSLLAGLAFALTGSGLSAQEQQSNEELARELANPDTTLGTLNVNFDYTSYKGDLPGADSQEAYRVSFQPALTLSLQTMISLVHCGVLHRL